MIGEHLDVLTDVLYYHKDQPLTICPSQTVWLSLWIAFNYLFFLQLWNFGWPNLFDLTVSQLLGGSAIGCNDSLNLQCDTIHNKIFSWFFF